MKYNQLSLILMIIFGIVMSSCLKRDYENPPEYADNALTPNTTILALKSWFAENNNSKTPKLVTEDWIIEGVVTSSDKTGNIYKQIFIQDSTAGITVSIDNTNLYVSYPQGRKVYIKLKGLTLGTYGSLVQIGYDVDNAYSPAGVFRLPATIESQAIYKGGFVGMPSPKIITNFGQLNDSLQSMYVELQNVELPDNELGNTYADAVAQLSKNRTLRNCNNQTITLRNSGFASFAGVPMPKGKGNARGVFTVFNSTLQFLISDTTDMADLTHTRCDGSDPNAVYILDEGFNTLSDWNAYSVVGAEVWTTATYGEPAPCAKMSGFAGGNKANEDWLISKELDLNGYSTVTMSFLSASKYTGDPLKLYISTDYDGTSAPSSATWTQITANFDTQANFSFNTSGPIDLSAYVNKKIRIAFKYTSTTSAATTWELDNVRVSGQ